MSMRKYISNSISQLAAIGVSVAVLGTNSLAIAETILVPKDAPTIQEAIDRAQGDDIVLVAPGRYDEAINFNGKAITLKSEKGAAQTTIDGWNQNDSVVKCISGEGPSTVLDGFTITGGTGNENLYSKQEAVGGGLLCLHSSPTIMNCIIVNNRAKYQGGAVFNGEQSNTVLRNCIVKDNTSERGGGFYNGRGRPEIINCEISHNSATYGGGGMYNFGSDVRIINSVFAHNRAEYNGGGVYDYDSGGRLVATVFRDNVALFSGNAVYRGYKSATVVDEDCTFIMEHDTISGSGGYMVAQGKKTGACCVGTGCLIVDERSCISAGGSWTGPNSTCEDQLIACLKPNAGDINTDGVVDMMDLVLVMTSMNSNFNN
jgi:hypothetical protein